MVPAGYSLTLALKGEDVSVQQKEFLTSEDGNNFITRLEGVSTCFFPFFREARVPFSQVNNFLAVVRPDQIATVYCNELQIEARTRVKRLDPHGIRVGEPVFADDIADIEEAVLVDAAGSPVPIPDDCGVVLILSQGWRKCLFYDYSVLDRTRSRRRTDDIPRLFGHFLSRLMFQEMYSVTDEQWRRLLEWGWFPFVGLRHEDRKKLLTWAACDRDATPVLEEISRSFTADLDARLESWRRYELLDRQMEFLARAKERYRAGDYLSCLSLLYPRIEGVMRFLFAKGYPGKKAHQGLLVTNLVENRDAYSVLLPCRFADFLKKVYFRDFDVETGEVALSRHSHGHGVSDAADYDFLRASVAFMLIDQLFHYLGD
jgi:hypothetical protein